VTPRVYIDNTVLSNLAKVGRANLAFAVWSEASATTPDVLREYSTGVASGAVPDESWSQLTVESLTADEQEFADQLKLRIGAGERSCLAVAAKRQGILATDDQDARQEARRRGIQVTGTVGLLVLAVRRQVLSLEAGNELLRQMIAAKYRSPVEVLDDYV
jgi:predicted nucleic acid-binding protein